MLVAVEPRIGGVLVRGEKGTAKSTAVRGLAAVLPEVTVVEGCAYGCDPTTADSWCHDCRQGALSAPLPAVSRPPAVVELPVSATEDRVVGSISLEHAIRHGERSFEAGLLARANRGILYVDEVNLLDDHLVDVLLDAAAMGVNTVEREGLSVTHPARFLLVGTMNPEEGDVRPQLLDRFGLCVDVEGVREPEARVEIVRRRHAFEDDPASFLQEWSIEQRELAERLRHARDRVRDVQLGDAMLYAIASISIRAGVDGHRADTVMARASAARAALRGRGEVTADDVAAVAPLVLAHRLKRRPFDDPVPSAQAVASLVEDVLADSGASSSRQDDVAPGVVLDGRLADPLQVEPEAEPDFSSRFERVRRSAEGTTQRVTSDDARGRYQRAEPMQQLHRDVALDATVRAAAPHQSRRESDGNAVAIEVDDLQAKVRTRRVGASIVLCVDASGSMGASARMEAAKGAALALLEQAYQRRDRVGVVTFRGDRAETVLAPTSSVELASQKLRDVKTGGATPLAHGILQSLEVLAAEKRRDAGVVPWLIVLTDGRANVGIGTGRGSEDALRAAARAADAGVHVIVVDTQASSVANPARELARAAGGEYVRIPRLDPAAVADAVRVRL